MRLTKGNLREASPGKTNKRTDSLIGSRSTLVLFTACLVLLGALAPAFGLGGQALARGVPYDFNELNGVNCNYTKQSGSGYPKVSSSPSDGNVRVALSTYAPNPDGFYIQTLSADAEGQAGVGITYIAPMTGRIKIDADVVVTGEDKLVESTLLWLPEGVTLIQSPWVKIIAEIVQVLDMALDASISALVQSGVEIRAHRINATPNDANNTLFASRSKPFLQPDLPHAPPIETDQKNYASELVKDMNTGTSPTLILDVTAGEALSVCVGIKSQVLATSIFPAVAAASANYDAKVQEIRISYLSEQSAPSPTPAPTPAPVQSCEGTWSIGQRVPLKKGAEIRQGSGIGYVVHTIVPQDNWPVDVIGGPRCIDGYDWWDISRTNIDGGGTGWVNRSQAAYVSGTSGGPLGYSGPEPPSYAPSFAGQTVSWNGNSFRSDDGKTWIFQGSDAERAAAQAAVKARELAEAEARAQDAGVYLQKANLLEPFMDINKNASDYGLADAEYVIIRGPHKATIYSWYRGIGDIVGVYSGEGTYKLPATTIGSVKAEIILPPVSEPIPNIPVPLPAPTPLPAPSGYSGQYFDNQTLSGTPKLSRNDTAINFDWGGGTPDPAIPIDHFSVRWTKTATFAAGTYQFSMTGDDGIRLYIDNVLAIDKWIDQGSTTYTATKTLSAGDHVIKMEYYENGGGAVAKLSYQQAIIPQGATWKYLDNNTRPAGWETTVFDDSVWKSGQAELGYGDGGEATLVGYGPDAGNKYITTYFRKTFSLTNVSGYSNLNLRVKRDDGAVVYLNGTEVFRNNMPAGAISHTTRASSAIDDSIFYSTSVSASLLREGTNAVAAEVHQAGGSSSDMSFDLSFTADIQTVGSTPMPAPAPAPAPAPECTELLPAPWHLEGINARELYQSIASTALQGKSNLKIMYNLHGLNALGGDASAIIFDQNGWRYISLSNYGQNGLDGAQTVTIPLSAFGLNLSQSVGTLHTRFWYSSNFVVDISSIAACS